MPDDGWKKWSEEEHPLATEWLGEGVEPWEIADRLKRDKSTVTRHCCKQVVRKRQGRPQDLKPEQVDFLIRRLDQMIVAAKGRYHVTAASMIIVPAHPHASLSEDRFIIILLACVALHLAPMSCGCCSGTEREREREVTVRSQSGLSQVTVRSTVRAHSGLVKTVHSSHIY